MGRWVGPILGLVACGAGEPAHEGAPAGGFDPGDVARRLEGAVTWSVDFGPAWEADGLSDCTYTRRYTGTEDRSVPWLCPACDVVFRVDVAMDDPDDLACYASLTGSTPAPVEWVGWSDDGRYFRSPLENYRLVEQGAVGVDGAQHALAHQVDDDGGGVAYGIDGTFEVADDPAADAWHGMLPSPLPGPSTCGWPRSGAPVYLGDHRLAVGALLPDGYFRDACNEVVRLHDFVGGYLVVDMSAADCPPCQDLAEGEAAFEAGLAAEGLDVTVITLMAPSLSAVLDPTPVALLGEWTDVFDVHGPVLADRGWGYWSFSDALGDDLGYPSYALVGPDLEVISIDVGFGPTAFPALADRIRGHAAAR